MAYPGTYEGVGVLRGEYTGVTCDRNFCFVPLSSKPENKPESSASSPQQDTNGKHVVSSPTPTYPLERSVSRDTLSSYSDEETESDEDELTPNPPNLDFFERALVECIMDQFWKIFNKEDNVTRYFSLKLHVLLELRILCSVWLEITPSTLITTFKQPLRPRKETISRVETQQFHRQRLRLQVRERLRKMRENLIETLKTIKMLMTMKEVLSGDELCFLPS
jgi:hypothetical protein